MTNPTASEHIAFANFKTHIFSLLDEGIVIKKLWDELIAEAQSLGMVSSLSQIQDKYDHYRIGEMGLTIEPVKVRVEAVPELIHHSVSVRTGYARMDQLRIWREALVILKEKIAPKDFTEFIAPLTLRSLSDSQVTLEAKTDYQREWVNLYAVDVLTSVLSERIESKVTVNIQ